MKTTVIIPVYNRERYVRTAILSLLRQSDDADLDIVVIDDGSTDRSAAIVSELAEEAPNIRLFRQPNRGIAPARNAGLNHIHPDAELVTFLDSDDVSVKGRFATELPLFREDAGLAFTYSKVTITDAIDDRLFAPPPHGLACTVRGINLGIAMFRRQTIALVGRFDEDLKQSEDLDYLLRLFELPLNYRMLDHVAMFYRRHATNITKAREQALRDLRLALLRSAQRRRRTGSVAPIPKFYDFTELQDNQYETLR